MKTLLSLLLMTAFATAAVADIQDSPMAQQTPSRKLGRGLANVAFGFSELPYCLATTNEELGNSGAWSYGFVRGVKRTFVRFSVGMYEIATAPVAVFHHTYASPLVPEVIWAHRGYTEFPPELGWETRFNYTRTYGAY